MLLKVMFNSILSSAPSLLCFYLSDVKFFSPHLMLLFTLHIGLFHLRFYVYFLSFFLSFLSLHFINCVCRVSCLYELFTSLFVHTYSVTISFPYLFFFLLFTWISAHFFLCVSSSIAFYLLTFFEFPDLRLHSQKHPDVRLILTELSFHKLSHPYLNSTSQRFLTLQETLSVSRLVKNRIKE